VDQLNRLVNQLSSGGGGGGGSEGIQDQQSQWNYETFK